MASDPDSVQNLVGEAAHRATLDRLRAALRQRMIDLKDNGLLPEGSALEGYDASHAAGAWPVERVVDLANRASDRDAAQVPQFIAALEDSSEPMRWWAAQGCALLREKAAPATEALRKHLDDPSGAVAVAAAEALARLGQVAEALPVLERWLENSANQGTAQLAGNVLDRLGEQARPALPVMKRVLASEKGGKGALNYPQRILEHSIAVLEGKQLPLVYPDAGQLLHRQP
jgi:tetratricopeptide (TPR) repeat protein